MRGAQFWREFIMAVTLVMEIESGNEEAVEALKRFWDEGDDEPLKELLRALPGAPAKVDTAGSIGSISNPKETNHEQFPQ